MTLQQIVFFGTIGAVIVMSLIALATFAKDKKLAIAGQERIKEKTLLALAACFGSAGALIGRIVAHHKTDKCYFSIVIWVSLVMHAALLVYTGYLAFIM